MKQKDEPMKCPYCDKPMQQFSEASKLPSSLAVYHTLPSVIIDRCEPCASTWFDRGELSAVSGSELSRFRFLGKKTLIKPRCRQCGAGNKHENTICEYCGESLFISCPRCAGGLFHANFLGFGVDTCFECGGIWMTDDVYIALCTALATPAARGVIVCSQCGQGGLTEKTSMLSETGPVCDACGLAKEEADMKLLQYQEKRYLNNMEWSDDELPWRSQESLSMNLLAIFFRNR